ncbi:hypothetical protein HXX76_002339 [Chlamydomonas incerta]|uniref:Uncharacterized protein n=1 Tax=Chlamydomonas incerta TaxID=51695 RepID=A0A835VPP0_CHLIN|nr:hypothetical protein HXX76_002339 [Chlamydomonas incerta]|eukprot:KAG2423115.1 hypothetical protein HXX76_002339 [Chlamydomonas incerta]
MSASGHVSAAPASAVGLPTSAGTQLQARRPVTRPPGTIGAAVPRLLNSTVAPSHCHGTKLGPAPSHAPPRPRCLPVARFFREGGSSNPTGTSGSSSSSSNSGSSGGSGSAEGAGEHGTGGVAAEDQLLARDAGAAEAAAAHIPQQPQHGNAVPFVPSTRQRHQDKAPDLQPPDAYMAALAAAAVAAQQAAAEEAEVAEAAAAVADRDLRMMAAGAGGGGGGGGDGAAEPEPFDELGMEAIMERERFEEEGAVMVELATRRRSPAGPAVAGDRGGARGASGGGDSGGADGDAADLANVMPAPPAAAAPPPPKQQQQHRIRLGKVPQRRASAAKGGDGGATASSPAVYTTGPDVPDDEVAPHRRRHKQQQQPAAAVAPGRSRAATAAQRVDEAGDGSGSSSSSSQRHEYGSGGGGDHGARWGRPEYGITELYGNSPDVPDEEVAGEQPAVYDTVDAVNAADTAAAGGGSSSRGALAEEAVPPPPPSSLPEDISISLAVAAITSGGAAPPRLTTPLALHDPPPASPSAAATTASTAGGRRLKSLSDVDRQFIEAAVANVVNGDGWSDSARALQSAMQRVTPRPAAAAKARGPSQPSYAPHMHTPPPEGTNPGGSSEPQNCGIHGVGLGGGGAAGGRGRGVGALAAAVAAVAAAAAKPPVVAAGVVASGAPMASGSGGGGSGGGGAGGGSAKPGTSRSVAAGASGGASGASAGGGGDGRSESAPPPAAPPVVGRLPAVPSQTYGVIARTAAILEADGQLTLLARPTGPTPDRVRAALRLLHMSPDSRAFASTAAAAVAAATIDEAAAAAVTAEAAAAAAEAAAAGGSAADAAAAAGERGLDIEVIDRRGSGSTTASLSSAASSPLTSLDELMENSPSLMLGQTEINPGDVGADPEPYLQPRVWGDLDHMHDPHDPHGSGPMGGMNPLASGMLSDGEGGANGLLNGLNGLLNGRLNDLNGLGSMGGLVPPGRGAGWHEDYDEVMGQITDGQRSGYTEDGVSGGTFDSDYY